MSKPGRNDPCPCGSGKKFKKCCLERYEEPASDAQETTPPSRPAPPEPVAFLDDIDRISNQAVDLIEEGRLDEAEQVGQRLLAEYPDLPDGFMRTAAVCEARGQLREAAKNYRKAADIQIQNDPEYGHELAGSLREQADGLDARAACLEDPHTTDLP